MYIDSEPWKKGNSQMLNKTNNDFTKNKLMVNHKLLKEIAWKFVFVNLGNLMRTHFTQHDEFQTYDKIRIRHEICLVSTKYGKFGRITSNVVHWCYICQILANIIIVQLSFISERWFPFVPFVPFDFSNERMKRGKCIYMLIETSHVNKLQFSPVDV